MNGTLPSVAPSQVVKPFTPPAADVGQIVWWWAYGEVENHIPLPAVVVSVGSRTLQLAILKPLVRSVDPRDGVRHISDPDARRDEFVEQGAWSHTPDTLLLHSLAIKGGSQDAAVVAAAPDAGMAPLMAGPEMSVRRPNRTKPKEPEPEEELEEMPKDEDDV